MMAENREGRSMPSSGRVGNMWAGEVQPVRGVFRSSCNGQSDESHGTISTRIHVLTCSILGSVDDVCLSGDQCCRFSGSFAFEWTQTKHFRLYLLHSLASRSFKIMRLSSSNSVISIEDRFVVAAPEVAGISRNNVKMKTWPLHDHRT